MNESQEVAVKKDFARAGLLSNGRYQVLVMQSGEGYSALGDWALTRWTAERLAAPRGTFLYVQDLDSGTMWSAAHEPVRRPADSYEAWLGPGCFHVRRSDEGIELHSETCVVPDADVELRRYTFANTSSKTRRLRVTSYAEPVLHSAAVDGSHAGFFKLFVETEHVADANGLLARRRPRSSEDQFPVLFHSMLTPGGEPVTFESDRAAFVGRGRSLADPAALDSAAALSGASGGVLDPALSLQTEIELAPGEEKELILIASAAVSRDQAIAHAEPYRSSEPRARAFLDAALREQNECDRFQLGPKNADRYHRLAAGVICGEPHLRAPAEVLGQESGESGVIESLGFSRAVPLLLGRIADESELPVARLLLRARDFWYAHGLYAQVVLLNDKSGAHAAELQEQLREIVDSSVQGHNGLVLRHADGLSDDAQRALESHSQLVVTGDRISLLRVKSDEPSSDHELETKPRRQLPRSNGHDAAGAAAKPLESPTEELRLENGYGGFTEDGREYVIRIEPDVDGRLQVPPMPWVNVIANEKVGFIISETGAGGTWHGNSRENRLTPWFNDPVLEPFGEAVYLHDVESQRTWSPTPGPAPSGASVVVRHGLGYTKFRQVSHDLDQRVTAFVPADAPLKVVRMDVTNTGSGKRRLRAGAFARWVLGGSESASRFVVTDFDDEIGAVTAVNRHNALYRDAVAFAVLAGDGEETSFTTSCKNFLGDGGAADPTGMIAPVLSGKAGAGLDPCAAFSRSFSLRPGETATLVFLLGQADASEEISALVDRYGTAKSAGDALAEIKARWVDITSRLQIQTPLPEIDLLVNAWLPYQNLSCRMWGRSAFYQSGGAFGYRDQLQDASAFAATMPELLRNQILLHAAHQFADGDVMHWWHPPLSHGIRTRFSDDLLWLPYVTLHYVETTGDRAILDEEVGYVEGPQLSPDEDEVFVQPTRSDLHESLYKHCCRAIDRSLTSGAHGLPLIGSGDWNDGMNRVGRGGQGESVWLGFFLYDILQRFIPVCEARSEMERVDTYRSYMGDLKTALEEAGWDGEWYRRGFYDNGEPIGSARSDECKIDALVQAWAVLSGAAPAERVELALDAMEHRLISEREGIIRLLAPPFDRTSNDPGYIKGYLPGVRENGGQYTHAALWAVRALAEAGRCERAAPLLAMLSPASHTKTKADADRYKVEPYVVAADVYGAPPHVGRGGWTWYTGSAGWMHRVAVESILGFRVLDGNTIEVDPCVPGSWDAFQIHYKHPVSDTTYDIEVSGSRVDAGRRRVRSISVNGKEEEPEDGVARLKMANDGRHYRVEIGIGV